MRVADAWIDDTPGIARAVGDLVVRRLPDTIKLECVGSRLSLDSERLKTSTLDLSAIADQQSGSRVENARSAAIAALNFVQDYVERLTRDPWPITDELASVEVVTTEDEVTVGFERPSSHEFELSVRLRRTSR